MIQVMILIPDIRKKEIEGKEITEGIDPIREIALIKVKGRIEEIETRHPAIKRNDITVKRIMHSIGTIKTPIRTPPDS